MTNQEFESQVNIAVEKMKKFAVEFSEGRESILEYAATPLLNAMKARAPIGIKTHYRYSTPKVNKSLRAPKGMGKRVATYKAGNLRRSFQTLKFKRSESLFVGVKLAKGKRAGDFGDSKFDGYYLKWLEFGTQNMAARPIVRPAVASAGRAVLNRLEAGYKLLAKKAATKAAQKQ